MDAHTRTLAQLCQEAIALGHGWVGYDRQVSQAGEALLERMREACKRVDAETVAPALRAA